MKLTARTTIRAPRAALLERALDPASHARWDLRFSEIAVLPGEPAAGRADAPQRFRYRTRLAGVVIEGWGETVGKPRGDGTILRFGSDQRCSLIREGIGSWTWRESAAGVRFATTYDYAVRGGALGRLADRLVLRPAMRHATRWSFDRLRLWLERGLAPELALRLAALCLAARTALGLVLVHEGLVLKLGPGAARSAELLERVGLGLGAPRAALTAVGAGELALGLALLAGLLSARLERVAGTAVALAALALAVLVGLRVPEALVDPLAGLPKNAGLAACGLGLSLLAPLVPRARNAR